MKKIEEFKSLEELLQYKKELETVITDEELLEEVVDNIWKELLNVNGYLNDIYNFKNSNRKWIRIILAILGLRSSKEHYKTRIINNCNSREKLYTLDDNLHQATVEEVNSNKEFNIILFTNGKENSLIYDEFFGKLDIEEYLDKKIEFSKLLEHINLKNLNEKEIKILNKYVFDSYKENTIKSKTKTRKCD